MGEKLGNNHLPPKQQVTKKQHYVWRGYLKRWAVDKDRFGRIYTYRLHPQGNQKTIEFAKLDEVGFGKYYYDVTGFSKKDVIVLARLIESLQGNNPIKVGISQAMIADADNRRDYIESLLERYEDIDNANHFIEKIIDGDLSFFSNSRLQQAADLAFEEMMNGLFGDRTISDEKLLNLAVEALHHSYEEDIKYDFLRFFFIQQERSPRVHDDQITNLRNLKSQYAVAGDLNEDFFANMMMVFFAEQIAINLSTKFHTWIERIENKSGIPFITSDCPVVNVSGRDIGQRHEFYFPLSPDVAMKLCSCYKLSRTVETNNKSLIIHDKGEIRDLNLFVAKAAYKELFSDREDMLQEIKELL